MCGRVSVKLAPGQFTLDAYESAVGLAASPLPWSAAEKDAEALDRMLSGPGHSPTWLHEARYPGPAGAV